MGAAPRNISVPWRFQRSDLILGNPKCETMGNAHAREYIFRPAQFPRDTFTAQDLKSDNMHEPQRAGESDSGTCSHRRDGPINAKTSSKRSPLYNPHNLLHGGTLSSFADVWLINHISYQISQIPRHKYSLSKLQSHVCVKYSSSAEQAT